MKLILAPMATLSHEALRRSIQFFGGCDEYYTEMIHAASFINGGQFEPYYARCGPEPEKTVWQLTGSGKEELARCAAMLMEQPPKQNSFKMPLGVDINMGCAAPAIYRQGAGIAWMLKPLKETEAMLNLVRKSFTGRLSVKIRLGDENFTLKGLFAFTDMLTENGVSCITLHPRTKKEGYGRPAHWTYVQLLAEHLKQKYAGKVSLIGNGGINNPETFAAAAKTAPLIEGLMIGRAAVQKPWIFAECKAEEKIYKAIAKSENTQKILQRVDLLELVKRFFSDLQECQPPEFHKTRIQRFFTYFCANFTFSHFIRSRILQSPKTESVLFILNEYFEQNPSERFAEFYRY